MTQEKIKIKDVTPPTFNPKTHKGGSDRFNPGNRIYVRAAKGCTNNYGDVWAGC